MSTEPKQRFAIDPGFIPEGSPQGHVVRRGEGRTVHYAGNVMQWKLEQDKSGGFCSVVEVVMRRGEEPPLHTHANEDEMYFVMEGDLTYYCGSDVFDVSPGDAVFLPRGTPHCFSVSRESGTARLMLLVLPSNSLRGYFDVMGVASDSPEMPPPMPDFPVAKAVEAIAPHEVQILGPGSSLVEDGLAPLPTPR